MDSKKKKGIWLKNTLRKLWFVFCALSFLVCLKQTAYAQKATCYYTFDMGSGISGYYQESFSTIKLVYRVEEDLDKPVTDPSRYNIINKDLTGFKDYLYDIPESGTGVCASIGIPSLTDDSNKTIYNFLAYTAATTKSSKSRKFMKSILMAMTNQGKQIYVEENGDRPYLRNDSEASGNGVTADSDFSSYKWLYDRSLINRDFYKYFNAQGGGYTPYLPSYAKNKMWYVEGGSKDDLFDHLSKDINILVLLNKEIESGTPVGTYLKSLKTTEQIDAFEDVKNLIWWYKENSFDAATNTILVDVGEVKPNALFTFKYDPNGNLIEAPDIGKMQTAISEQNFDYQIEYSMSQTGTYLTAHPDYTGGSLKKLSSYFMADGNHRTPIENFYVAVDYTTHAQNCMGNIYVTSFLKSNTRENNAQRHAYGKICCSILKDDLNKIIEELGGDLSDPDVIIRKNNGYVFAFSPRTKYISFYKENDPTYVGMNMNLNDMYAVFEKGMASDTTFGLALKADPRGKNGTSFTQIGNPINGQVQYRAPLLMSGKVPVNRDREPFSYEWNTSERRYAMFYSLFKDSGYDCLLTMYDMTEDNTMNRGTRESQAINIDKCSIIARISIRDWLLMAFPDEAEQAREDVVNDQNRGLTGQIRSYDDMLPGVNDFFKMLLKYAKVIIMFLIFLAICIASILAIMEHGDADKRALLKTRIMHILMGAAVFAVLAFVLGIAGRYFNEATKMIIAEDVNIDYDIDGMYQGSEDWFLNILQEIVDSVAYLVKWGIDFLGSRMLGLGDRKLDLSDVIFNVEEAGGISLYPFTKVEWKLYMYGYYLLTTLGIAIIAIALVRHITMIIIDSGKPEKIAAVKEDFMRTVVAILCIVLVPYAFRIMLTLINSLVKLIPVAETKFDLDFEKYGLVGSIANIIYLVVEAKIFIVFIVRKVMMTFLLISTPVVFGIWAISNKFRSFNLWLGELVTNAFMQFSYAFVFFFLIIMLSDEQNPFAVLLMLGMLMKLSDFLRNSLQGIFNEAGGIKETQIAERAFNGTINTTKNITRTAKKTKKKIGTGMMNTAKYWDNNQMTKGGTTLHNVGAVMAGKYGNTISERQRLMNAQKYLRSEASSKHKYMENTDKDLREIAKIDPEFKNVYDDVMAGNVSAETLKKIRNKGGNYARLASYAENREGYETYMRSANNIDRNINNLNDITSLYENRASDEMIKNTTESKNLGSKNANMSYDEMKKEYDGLVSKMDELMTTLEKGDLSEEDATKKKADLNGVCNKILDKGVELSQKAVVNNIKFKKEDITDGQIKASTYLTQDNKAINSSKGFNTTNADKIQIVSNNLKIIEDKQEKDALKAKRDEYHYDSSERKIADLKGANSSSKK